MDDKGSGGRRGGLGLTLAVLSMVAPPAAADNPAQRSEAAAAVLAVPERSTEEAGSLAESVLARREQAMGRRLDPVYRAVLKGALAARPAAEIEALGAGETLPPLEPGDTAADLLFTPVAPCRVLDTRLSGGAIPATGQRAFNVAGDVSGQGGAVNCGVPLGAATAAVLNFVAVTPQGPGNLRAWPSGGAVPTASILNYAAVAGLNIANGIVLPLCTGSCSQDVVLQADASGTHVVVDVMGYFRNVRLPAFVGANWSFGAISPPGNPANQLAIITVTPALTGLARLRARGYCNIFGLGGASNEIHLAIGLDAGDAYNTGPNPPAQWGIVLVPAGAPVARHVSGFTSERFVAVSAGITYTFRVFGRHQTGGGSDDCSGQFVVDTTF